MTIEQVQDFWDRRPCNIRHSPKPVGTREYFDEVEARVTEMWVDHIFPYRIPDYVQYRYVKVWYFRWMPKPLFRWLERYFGWHLCVTACAPEGGVPC
ncbi:MAG: hypothetical protein ACP5NB_13465 [Chloroflexia bacterium]